MFTYATSVYSAILWTIYYLLIHYLSHTKFINETCIGQILNLIELVLLIINHYLLIMIAIW